MSKLSDDKLIKALEHKFNQHRIVIWYDSESRLREFFNQVNIPGITKLEISNNEFGLKYHILMEEPEKKFLLFKEGPKPDEINNWLLDIELAYTEFKADQGSIWLSDLGLGPEFIDLVTSHSHFFEDRDRRNLLKSKMDKTESEQQLKLKMLAVCKQTSVELYEILESLISDVADEKDTDYILIEQCSLHTFLWDELKKRFQYKSKTPTVKDFAIQLFETSYGYAIGDERYKKLSQETLIFMQRWQASREYHTSFNTLSKISDGILKIESTLHNLKIDKAASIDSFESVETYISNSILHSVSSRTITVRECEDIISRRRGGYWYKEYEQCFLAAKSCLAFFQSINDISLNVESYNDGIRLYAATWFVIDRHYRNALHALKQAGNSDIIHKLMDDVQNAYVNKYLIKLNDSWQRVVDSSNLDSDTIMKQSQFFLRKIKPFVDSKNKVAVIISDALRYESGVELMDAIRKEDKYEASIESMISMLPSYTSLGMAALLPHKVLKIDVNGSVFADGKPTADTQNRSAILSAATNNRAVAIKNDAFNSLNRDEIKEYKRENEVLYIYHNRIDSVGDKRDTEERVVEAVGDAINEILSLIRKLAGADFYNIIVTADHGFLYQNQPVEDTDFIELGSEWSGASYRDRRFIIGKNLPVDSGMMKRKTSELGLEGDLEISFPKSINRLRLSGSGSRYVHGGVSLQEMVIPIISINKKRKSDITFVEVDIMQRGSNRITTGQVTVFFYQMDPVTEKVHPRKLIAGIYTADDKLLSQQEELIFDIVSSESQDREVRVTFRLTADVSAMNNQEVFVKLKVDEEDTSYKVDYKTRSMILQTRFEHDF